MTLIAIALFLVHIVICLFVAIGSHAGKFNARIPYLPLVFCLPVLGVLIFMLEENRASKPEGDLEEIALESVGLSDVKYERIQMDSADNAFGAVPLEEAMMINEASIRRALMKDVINTGSSKYVDILQEAAGDRDTELAHYATTSMMELQSEYEKDIRSMEPDAKQFLKNENIQQRYEKSLCKYVESGLLSGGVLEIYRTKRKECLKHLLNLKETDHHNRYLLLYLENMLGNDKLAGKNDLDEDEKREIKIYLDEAKSLMPQEEKVCFLMVRYFQLTKQADKIRPYVSDIQNSEVYLSSAGQTWFAFWSGAEV